MSEPKTIPADTAVAPFLAAIEPEAKRQDAAVIDTLFQRVTGELPRMWGASIVGYGEYRTTYESGREVHWMRAGFSPRKARHTLYLQGGYCDDGAAAERTDTLRRLGKHSTGKSCLYITKLADVDLAVLEQIIADDWRAMARLFPET